MKIPKEILLKIYLNLLNQGWLMYLIRTYGFKTVANEIIDEKIKLTYEQIQYCVKHPNFPSLNEGVRPEISANRCSVALIRFLDKYFPYIVKEKDMIIAALRPVMIRDDTVLFDHLVDTRLFNFQLLDAIVECDADGIYKVARRKALDWWEDPYNHPIKYEQINTCQAILFEELPYVMAHMHSSPRIKQAFLEHYKFSNLMQFVKNCEETEYYSAFVELVRIYGHTNTFYSALVKQWIWHKSALLNALIHEEGTKFDWILFQRECAKQIRDPLSRNYTRLDHLRESNMVSDYLDLSEDDSYYVLSANVPLKYRADLPNGGEEYIYNMTDDPDVVYKKTGRHGYYKVTLDGKLTMYDPLLHKTLD